MAESNKKFIANKRLERDKKLEEEKKLIEYNKQKKRRVWNIFNKKITKNKRLEFTRIRERQNKSNDLKSHLDYLGKKRSFESTKKFQE